MGVSAHEDFGSLHFFAFWVGFRQYCCRTFNVLRRNHSRAISNFPISRSYYCAIRSFYEVFYRFGFEIFFLETLVSRIRLDLYFVDIRM